MQASLFYLLFVAIFAFVSVALGQSINFRWCYKGQPESMKCQTFIKVLKNGVAEQAGVNVSASCVDGINAEGCMKKINEGTADLITLDGGEIYTAGKKYGMVPVVAEDYGGNKGTFYYAVAVAKANRTGLNLGNLKGKKSCHTGYQKTAGYNTPVGYLLQSKKMKRVACGETGTAKSVSAFFTESCIPGSPPKFPNLCAVCPQNNCAKSKSNPYYDYSGAFKCLADGAGHVAFIKHLTVPEMVSKGGYGSLSDYVYLCKDNTRKVITASAHEDCNLAKVPSHAVMTKSGNNVAVYTKVLLKASELCQGNLSATNCSGFKIFESPSANKDILFKDSTKKLIDISTKGYREWLGDDYYQSIEGLTTCPKQPGSRAATMFTPVFLLMLIIGRALVTNFL